MKNNKDVTFIADFPDGVTEPAQYGLSILKSSINIFLQLVSQKLTDLKFEDYIRNKLIASPVLHTDETGVIFIFCRSKA